MSEDSEMQAAAPSADGDDPRLGAFVPVRIRRAADEVVLALVNALQGGLYGVGESLPRPEDLAKRFGVSRAVVREAIERLRIEGIVSVHRGRTGGTVVISRDGLDRVLAGVKSETHSDMAALLESRRVLERAAAALVGSRCSAGELDHLVSVARQLELAVGRGEAPEVIRASDLEFHFELARLSGNSVIAAHHRDTMQNVSSLRGFYPFGYVDVEEAVQNQIETAEVLATRDLAKIDQKMLMHLGSLEELLLGRRLQLP